MASVSLFAGSVPANYDKYLGPILFEPYALDLIERLKKDNVEHLLELACGTGRVTKHLVDLIPGNGSLVATDLNPGMLEIAKEKVGSAEIDWKVANAQELPFENAQFDHIVCQFGVMFFPDKEESFREANRVLTLGGKYVFNVWESLEKNPRSDMIWQTIKEMFRDDSPEFFQKGPYSFNDKEIIEQFLLKAGFKNVKIEVVAKTPKYNEPGDLITGFAEGSSLYNYLAEKDEGTRRRFKTLLRQRLVEQETIYGNTVPSRALVVESTK